LPDIKIDETNQTIWLEVDVDEGKQFYVSSVQVLGFGDSATQIILQDFLLKPGVIYNSRLVDMFLEMHPLPTDTSLNPRFLTELDEKRGTMALTFDFRTCTSD